MIHLRATYQRVIVTDLPKEKEQDFAHSGRLSPRDQQAAAWTPECRS